MTFYRVNFECDLHTDFVKKLQYHQDGTLNVKSTLLSMRQALKNDSDTVNRLLECESDIMDMDQSRINAVVLALQPSAQVTSALEHGILSKLDMTDELVVDQEDFLQAQTAAMSDADPENYLSQMKQSTDAIDAGLESEYSDSDIDIDPRIEKIFDKYQKLTESMT